jgi:serine O-acetyltransferase
VSEAKQWPPGLRGDLARLFSSQGTHEGRPSLGGALIRAVTRPGPLAILLYRVSHRLWARGLHSIAELIWRLNYFLSGADIHPGAQIGGGLRLTHTAGLVVGKGAVIGSDVTLLHGVTLGGSSRGFFDPEFTDGFPTIGDGSKIAAGAKLLGPITIGKACFIGANSVVAKDLPDGTIYTPGRKVSELSRRVDELERELRELRSEIARETETTGSSDRSV